MNIKQIKKLDIIDNDDLRILFEYGREVCGPHHFASTLVDLSYDHQTKEASFKTYIFIVQVLAKTFSRRNHSYYIAQNSKLANTFLLTVINLIKKLPLKTFEFYNHMNSFVKQVMNSSEFFEWRKIAIYAWSNIVEKLLSDNNILFNSFNSLLQEETQKVQLKVELYTDELKMLLKR